MTLARRRRRQPPAPAGAKLLFEFLQTHNISYVSACAALHVSHPTVYHWAIGVKRPNASHQDDIETWTAGAVPRTSWRRSSEDRKAIAPFRTDAA